MKKKNKTNTSSRRHRRLSSDIVIKYLSQRQEPANTKAIAETLGRVGKEGRQETFEILEKLRDEGKVSQLSKHRWAMKHAIHEHRGRVVGHVDGHGFVLTDETKEKVFLRAHDMREVLHNDTVDVRITGRDRRKKLFGQILNIVERGNDIVVGRYFNESNTHFVVPDDQRIGQDIFVMPDSLQGAKSGQVVSVKITQYPTKNFQPMGEIIEVLGDYLSPGMEIEIAIRKHQLPHEWPDAVQSQIKSFSEDVSEHDFDGRKDIRDLPLVTIDGEDARDFDDAVYCESLEGDRHRLVVAIADVSSYVKEQSPLDLEAWQRGTSVYFPSNVIPMLPEVLSNGLCSLKPKVNRLCFVCDMQIDKYGEIESYEFYQAVMYSHARLTYTQVAALIDGQNEESGIDQSLQPAVLDLYALSQKLGGRRREGGMIEFEIPEPVIVFDEERKIERVDARVRNDAHRLIEECMLAANICASLLLNDSELAGIYRVHDEPDEDRIEDARAFLRQFKLLLGGRGQPSPKDFSEVVKQVDDPLISKVVQTALLRSMKQARYSVENTGHFALDFDSYTHFTSPIRRYPDLLVHRQIRRFLENPECKDNDDMFQRVEQTAEQTSMAERRAESATREVTQWLKCEFMSHKIGQNYYGIVSSVTEFGLFIELSDFYIEGLIHITSLGQDYYRFEPDRRQLVGERSGRVYKSGDRLEIKVARVDMEQGRIDFALTDVLNERLSRAKNKPTKGSGKSYTHKNTSQNSKGKKREKTSRRK